MTHFLDMFSRFVSYVVLHSRKCYFEKKKQLSIFPVVAHLLLSLSVAVLAT